MRCDRCVIPEHNICAGERVRRLCELADERGPHYRSGYKRILEATAVRRSDDVGDANGIVGYTLHTIKIVNLCMYRNVEAGCCVGARCAIRNGEVVTNGECIECARTYGLDFGLV